MLQIISKGFLCLLVLVKFSKRKSKVFSLHKLLCTCIAAQCVRRCCVIVIQSEDFKQQSVPNILSLNATDRLAT
uniref:Uncharacterized protein n=1 Tax=Octopus bimaculoides TaxID=37653 RepID=A0A0L8FY28_OCTBM